MSRILLMAPILLGALPAQARVEFKGVFAPTDNIVAAPERPLRQSLCLNGRWQFQPVKVPAGFVRDTGTPPVLSAPHANGWETTAIKIPSPWNVNTWGNGRHVGAGTDKPYAPDSVYYPSYPASWEGAEMGWLRRSFSVPPSWKGKRVVLHFEAVAGDAQVIVNGKAVGEHFDSFLPFDLDVTSALKATGSNELLVGVRKSNLFDKASPDYPIWQRRTYPNGSNMDNLVGIWNDVWLVALPPVRTHDAFLQSDVKNGVLRAQITLRNDSATAQRVRVGGEVKAWVNDAGKDVLSRKIFIQSFRTLVLNDKKEVLSAPVPKWHLGATALALPSQAITVGAGKSITLQLQAKVGGKLKLWSPTTPNLYGAVFSVTDAKGQKIDSKYERFGWRQFSIQGSELHLNGRKIQLYGDLLHPFGPFIGSRRYAWAQLKTIKDAGGNMIRPHAQPHPPFYLDLADEMGVCVLDEAANFGSSVSQNLKEGVTWSRMQDHVDHLVLRDRNHASVFGWSVANEMFAPLSGPPADERARETKLLADLAKRPARLDPTRDWVSIDGDQDLGGTLPVWSRHYGLGLHTLPSLEKPATVGEKPLMVGEHGGTYFAAPPIMQGLGGERVFESVAGRNFGLGVDLYQALTNVAKPNLAVFSPSEVAWFGLEHLPFGFAATNRLPNQEDGIWFGPYVEGQAGVQIERLPPYVMTFNPGFDPTLPLRRPLPMYDAWRDALAGTNAAKWAVPAPEPPRQQPAPLLHGQETTLNNTVKTVAFAGDRDGVLFDALTELGVPFEEPADGPVRAAVAPRFLVIDAETLAPADAMATINQAKEIVASRGTVWIMARDKGARLPLLSELLGDPLTTKPRVATSLLHGSSDATTDKVSARNIPDPMVEGFSLSNLYFADEKPILHASLEGQFVKDNQVLLRAAKTDWRLFERQPESAKQAAIVMYEHLNTGEGAALVQKPLLSNGRLWVSTLDPTSNDVKERTFWVQLWRNLGVQLVPSRNWLVMPGREGDSSWKFTLDTPAANWTAPDFADGAWPSALAPFGSEVPDGKPKTNWNTSDIWVRRDFDVKEIPPALRLLVHHDEDVEVYLNGVRIWSEPSHITAYKEIELSKDALAALKTGRNVLAAHCHQTAGGQFLDVGLSVYAPKAAKPEREHNLLLDGPPQG